MRHTRTIWVAVAMVAVAALACGPTTTTPSPAPPTAAPPTVSQPEPTAPPAPTAVPEIGTSLTIINDSQSEIWYVYISPSDAEQWGDDWLGGAVIRPGEAYTIANLSDGVYDVKAADQDNQPVEIVWGLDVQGEMSWTVTGLVSIEISNQSGVTITDVYVSPTESTEWGENWLETVIPAGATGSVSGIPQGRYDIKAADSTGAAIEIAYNVALSGPTTWTVVGKTALPANAVLRFEDQFSDNRNNWGRNVEDADVFYMNPADGEYCILIKSDQFTAWEWYEPFRPDEFVAEVMCRTEGADDATCGLGFGPDGDNLYWFEVSASEQAFALFLLENGEWQDSLIAWSTTSSINPRGPNALSMERVGGTVSVYVNGILVGSVPSDRFPTGRVGIGGSTYQGKNATVCMDNLRVWRLE